MPTLAGWLTGEQVPQEIIEQTLTTMGSVLEVHGGRPTRIVQPGAGLVTYSDPAYSVQKNTEPPMLDWVPDRRTMVYRRPLSGAHLLYYVEDWPAEGNLLFASEIKALLAVGVPRRLHLAALHALLHYGFIPAPWTTFQNVHAVPAGSILRWQRGKTVVNASTDYYLDDPLSGTDLLDQLHTLLDETTAALLPPHEQLVALTDGGEASALAIALTARHTETSFTVAALGYKKNMKAAESIASACQRPFLAITGVDQPEFWIATLAATEAPCLHSMPLAFHQLLHTVSAETGARVAISGLGGSRVTAKGTIRGSRATGVEHPLWGRGNRFIEHVVAPTQIRSDFLPSHIWSKDAAQSISQETPWEETLHARKLARQAAKFSDAWQQQYYLDLHLHLPDFIVGTAQQLATAERMVIRSPYLASDVMNMFIRLPAVLSDGTPREEKLSALAQRYMPNVIAGQSTSSLEAPTMSLLRVADSELLQQTISQEALRATGIFDPEVVQDLLRQGEQEDGVVTRELVLVFTTQLLCQLFEVGM